VREGLFLEGKVGLGLDLGSGVGMVLCDAWVTVRISYVSVQRI
jgi:hypothetical protein